MRYVSLCLALFAATGLVSACSDDTSEGCVSDEACRDGRICSEGVCTDEAESNPDPGEFAGFFWESTDTYMTGYSALPGQGGDGFRVRLFATRDGGAVVLYEEGILGHGFNPYHPNYSDDYPDTRRRIDTSWSVEASVFIVGDVLRCEREQLQDREGLSCVLERDVVAEEAAGATVRLEPGREEAAPDDAAFADYRSE